MMPIPRLLYGTGMNNVGKVVVWTLANRDIIADGGLLAAGDFHIEPLI
jgi:hypothetical protein